MGKSSKKFDIWFKSAQRPGAVSLISQKEWAKAAWNAAKNDVDVLSKPARVNGTVFREGIRCLTVIKAAQRHYEFMKDYKPFLSHDDALKLASGELVLIPKIATQEHFRAFYDAFNKSEGGNTAQRFKDAYRALTDVTPTNEVIK